MAKGKTIEEKKKELAKKGLKLHHYGESCDFSRGRFKKMSMAPYKYIRYQSLEYGRRLDLAYEQFHPLMFLHFILQNISPSH